MSEERRPGRVRVGALEHGAFFLVWTEQKDWTDVPLSATVKGYVDLQTFVKEKAQAAGYSEGTTFGDGMVLLLPKP